MTILNKSAEIVQKALCEKGLKFEIVELNASTRTANDAAYQRLAERKTITRYPCYLNRFLQPYQGCRGQVNAVNLKKVFVNRSRFSDSSPKILEILS